MFPFFVVPDGEKSSSACMGPSTSRRRGEIFSQGFGRSGPGWSASTEGSGSNKLMFLLEVGKSLRKKSDR